MNDVVIPYKPRELQLKIHTELKRWNVIVCHRRFGKTVLTINHLLRDALLSDKQNPRYAYLAPTYKQAKNIAWDYLKYYSRPIPGIKVNESELRIDYPNGARIQLYGCDTPDALRGIYLDGVVLDEYAQMPRSLFGEVIRPALSDRKGWAIFIGTPKGHNAFYDMYTHGETDPDWYSKTYRASDTGVIDDKELDDARRIMTPDEYEQEYECSWSAAVRGAIYAQEIAAARVQNRIGFVPIDPSLDLMTFWDLGISDAMSIWFAQAVGKEIRFIHYYENAGEGMPHYIKYIKDFAREHNLRIGDQFAPHDIEVRELSTGKSRKDSAREMGFVFRTVPKHGIQDGIETARRLFSRCWFDARGCGHGIDCLSLYRREYDDKRQVFRDTPLHDWTSHCADAFRTFAMAWGDRLAAGSRPPAAVVINKGFNPLQR